jgi:SAM-dependent methyltransferase
VPLPALDLIAQLPPLKTYDKAYFDRWYRDQSDKVATGGDVRRKAQLVVGIAEVLLQRRVRSVLDVGCGEAPWRAALRKLRPGIQYQGIDSSEYVVERFGKSRQIRHGAFGTVGTLKLRGPFDLIVCCDVLQYVSAADLRTGLGALAPMLGGVAYLEAYTTADEIEGDRHAWHHRTSAAYRKEFAKAGLTGVGMHCWVGDSLRPMTTALERSTP